MNTTDILVVKKYFLHSFFQWEYELMSFPIVDQACSQS